MAPLDPWIIEEIKKREREKEEERKREQPTVPADDPREIPERRDEPGRNPGYEMPSPGDPKREDRPSKKDESDRGVTVIDIGGSRDDDDDDANTIDITKIPGSAPEEKGEKRPD